MGLRHLVRLGFEILTRFLFMQELMNECNHRPYLGTWMDFGRKQFEITLAAVIFFLQLTSPVSGTVHEFWSIPSAEAVLYSPETKIPRTGELALRRAIPANTNMKAIQVPFHINYLIFIIFNSYVKEKVKNILLQLLKYSLEDISYLLRIPQRKPFGTMEGNVKKALKVMVDQYSCILHLFSCIKRAIRPANGLRYELTWLLGPVFGVCRWILELGS